MITSAGVGSGIDIESIISNLMDVERVPLQQLQTKKSGINIKLSAFGTIKSQMSAMKDLAVSIGDTTKFGNFVATSSDEEIFTASTTLGVNAENHDINVISLAQNNRLKSAAFADENATVGMGTFSFSSGDESFDITIDATNDSLVGLRNAINDSALNTSINASILNVDGGSRLVLTANEGGTANAITAPSMFSELTAAVDATFEIDGFLTTSSSNTVTDVISGVALELKSIGSAKITSERDSESLRATLDEFVSSYNKVKSNLKISGENTLSGDNTNRTFTQRMSEAFFEPIDVGDGETLTAFQLGFTFDKEGTLSIDESKFTEITSQNMGTFINAFTDNENGFAQRIEDKLTEFTAAGGLIDNKKEGLDNQNSRIDNQIERLDNRLIQTEARYRRQFTAMDQMVAQLKASSEQMASQLQSLG